MDAQNVALLILRQANEMREPISNLKLQKLLYYEQGYHLAYFGTPLFKEEIEAWQYGPVVPNVYENYKMFEDNAIVINFTEQIEEIQDPVAFALFKEVFNVYNRYTANGLVQLTHNETPWLSVYPPERGKIIPQTTMLSFFKTKLRD